MERVLLVKPGQSFRAGDRELLVVAPPAWDSPATHCLFDPAAGVLFAADSLGALLPAPAAELDEVPEAAFWQGFQMFASAISPWLHLADQGKLEARLAGVRGLQPKVVLSSHGPVVRGRTDALLDALAAVPAIDPFLGPDQAEMMQIMANLRTAQAA